MGSGGAEFAEDRRVWARVVFAALEWAGCSARDVNMQDGSRDASALTCNIRAMIKAVAAAEGSVIAGQ